MLPSIDLPDLLFEVNSWAGFLDAFTHVSEGSSRMAGLPVSLVALLVAESCNIGLTPVTNPHFPHLTRSRLSHVDQNYLRGDTIAAANAKLIEAQSQIPLAQSWGGGLLASVDGMRFVVPARTINAAPSPKYYGYKRGITWLNAVNDQVSGIGTMVVPGTPCDSLFILDALLNLDGGVKPEMVATTTPRIPTWCSGCSRCSVTASPRGSGTSPTSGSGARTSPAGICPTSPPAGTGRWRRSRGTR
jgi:hypothetical protein